MNEYKLVAVKRRWVPEWLFAILASPIDLVKHQPLRWLFTKPPSSGKFCIHYEDSEGADHTAIGRFDTRQEAINWMLHFAGKHCPGCEIERNDTWECITIRHPYGAVGEMWIIPFYETETFLEGWNV